MKGFKLNGILKSHRAMRLLAFIIDMAVVLALSYVCYSFSGVPDYPSVSTAMDEQAQARGTGGEQEATMRVFNTFDSAYRVSLIIFVCYELLSQAALRGATVGKRICGLRVVPRKPCAAPAYVLRAAGRTVVKAAFIYLFSGIPFIISVLTLFANSEGRAGVDFFAGTRVVGGEESAVE